MKYYVYLSQSKIEMLFQQTATASKPAKEKTLEFDLKVLKGGMKESSGVPVSQYGQLRSILDELEANELVGEIDDDKPYVRGTLEMIWGVYGWTGESDITFWGCAANRTALGMAGSSYNLLGQQRQGTTHSYSFTLPIVEWIKQQVGWPSQEAQTDPKALAFATERAKHLSDNDVARATYIAVSEMEGESAIFDFVAKVLHRSDWPEGYGDEDAPFECNRIVLATPLYVAMES